MHDMNQGEGGEFVYPRMLSPRLGSGPQARLGVDLRLHPMIEGYH